jgi:hypothetical protein
MAKKKQSKASWRKRGVSIEEALRSAREAVDQDRRTGGALTGVTSEQLFTIEGRPRGEPQAVRRPSRRERREAQPTLWVDRVVAGNVHIQPVVPPRQRPAAKAEPPRKKAAASAGPIGKKRKSKALKLQPMLPVPGPAGQLPRTMLGELRDVWTDPAPAPTDAAVAAVREVAGDAALVPSQRRPVSRASFAPRSSTAPASTGRLPPPKLKLPAEGASFNPDRTAHQELLRAAVAHETERARREKRPKWRVDAEAVEEGARVRLLRKETAGLIGGPEGGEMQVSSGGGEDGEEGEGSDGEGGDWAAGSREVLNKKKTAQKLARARRVRERAAADSAAKAARKREVQLGRLGPLSSEIKKEAKELGRRQAEAAARQEERRHRIGRLRCVRLQGGGRSLIRHNSELCIAHRAPRQMAETAEKHGHRQPRFAADTCTGPRGGDGGAEPRVRLWLARVAWHPPHSHAPSPLAF